MLKPMLEHIYNQAHLRYCYRIHVFPVTQGILKMWQAKTNGMCERNVEKETPFFLVSSSSLLNVSILLESLVTSATIYIFSIPIFAI